MVRLFIIEDHQMLIESYLQYFSKFSELEVLGSANDSSQAIEMLEKITPDVILLDFQLKNSPLDGIELIKRLRELLPTAKLFVITQFSGKALYHKLIQLGVRGFREKNISLAELTKAIIGVSDGLLDFLFMGEPIQLSEFTDIGIQILRLKAQGKTTKEVSSAIAEVSEDTIGRTLKKMREQVGAVSTEELIYFATKLGLI